MVAKCHCGYFNESKLSTIIKLKIVNTILLSKIICVTHMTSHKAFVGMKEITPKIIQLFLVYRILNIKQLQKWC